MLFHNKAVLLTPEIADQVWMDVEESQRWSFEVVDDEDDDEGHAYAKTRFDKGNTACGQG